MKGEPAPTLRLHLALILLSAALIAFQLEQMQLLALMQWHHFAYLIISVALLGFGASGTFIVLFRTLLLRHLEWLLPALMFACAITMTLALPLSQEMTRRFDISLLFVEPGQAVLLLLSQCIYLLVFFLGALPLGLVFIHFSSRLNSLYCANLVGSGVGGIIALSHVFPATATAARIDRPAAMGGRYPCHLQPVPPISACRRIDHPGAYWYCCMLSAANTAFPV